MLPISSAAASVDGRSTAAARVLILLLALCASLPAFAQVPVPPLRAPITDVTNTLTPEQIAQLDRQLREFEGREGSQIAVLIVATTQPETIEQFSIRVADAWKLGRRGVDDGVLIVLAKEDRAVRIEVGRGLEGALPDVIANRVTDQVMVPRFREGDFYGGLTAAIERIIAVIEGEPLPEASGQPSSASRPVGGLGSAFPLLLMLLFVGGGILRRMFGRAGGALVTGGVAGLIVWILTSVVAVAIGAAVIGFLFTIFTGGSGGGFGGGRRRRGGWPGVVVGPGGWGGGSWGGGGGWSGGGGGFGGGGASGRW